MSNDKPTTYAVIQVTVEVPLSSYGPDWTIAAVVEQAATEGVRTVENALQKVRGRCIGKPTIKTVTTITDPQP